MTLSLITFPHRALTSVCEPVPDAWFNGDTGSSFLTQIVEIANVCHRSKGLALAANQVGVLYRFIVILPHPKLSRDCTRDGVVIAPPNVVVNPQVIDTHADKVLIKEGCLSFPGLDLPVTRPARIEVSWQDNRGTKQTALFSGLLARVIQHEMDHLDGIQYIDRLSAFDKVKFSDKINKLRGRRKALRP